VDVYLDTSSFLKLFFSEPESARVAALIAAERRVVVSSLVRLETLVHIRGRRAGGLLSKRATADIIVRIDDALDSEPYEVVTFPTGALDAAEARVREASGSVHCRTLDRLHLAAMEVLGIRRLLTNDDTQAAAARALDLEVVLPR
jgi:predicted nucleic acid-binding protein